MDVDNVCVVEKHGYARTLSVCVSCLMFGSLGLSCLGNNGHLKSLVIVILLGDGTDCQLQGRSMAETMTSLVITCLSLIVRAMCCMFELLIQPDNIMAKHGSAQVGGL